MAKLYFNYSTMNAGKSTVLLQASHNYIERGMQTYLLIARFDDRAGTGRIGSRIGIGADADTFGAEDDLFEMIANRSGACGGGSGEFTHHVMDLDGDGALDLVLTDRCDAGGVGTIRWDVHAASCGG